MEPNPLRESKIKKPFQKVNFHPNPDTKNDPEFRPSEGNHLVGKHLPFAKMIAFKIAKTMSKDADVDDMISSAGLGLLEAARRFDPSFEVAFEEYAYHRIQGAVYDGLRKTLWLPHHYYSKLMKKKNSLEQTIQGKKITQDSSQSENNKLPHYIIYLDNHDDAPALEDKETIDIEQFAAFKRLRDPLIKFIEELPQQHREIVNLRYYEGKSLEEVGRKLGLSKSWVSRLHCKILRRLFKKINQWNPNLGIEVRGLCLQ